MAEMLAALCGVSKGLFVTSRGKTTLLIASTICMSGSVLFSSSIAKCKRSFLGVAVSAQFVSDLVRTLSV